MVSLKQTTATTTKVENLNTLITSYTYHITYRHERARDEFRQCETNAQREGCFVATRVKFANSEEMVVELVCCENNRVEVEGSVYLKIVLYFYSTRE